MFVHTAGDSGLDSYYWMLNGKATNVDEATRNCVEGQLQTKLGKDYTVESHAYDGFTTTSVLKGAAVGAVLGIRPGFDLSAKQIAYLENRKCRFVKPLEELKKSIEAHPDATHFVVLHVGGNDFRERLSNPFAILFNVPKILKQYFAIIDTIKDIKARDIRPIIMMQYRLDANNDCYHIYKVMKVIGTISLAVNAVACALLAAPLFSWPLRYLFPLVGAALLAVSSRLLPITAPLSKDMAMGTLGGLMQRFYKPILTMAKREGIPVLDLPNTFNPYESLYISGIEPGKKGSELIAEGIDHIVKHHDFASKQSKLYYKGSAATYQAVDNNPSRWKVFYN